MLCPSHEDANPSASLAIKPGGKVLWHCYAGCDQPTLTKAIRAIPGALLPRPVIREQLKQPGRVYIHRPDLRERFATAIEGCDPSLLASNPPGSDWAQGYGSQHGIEDRARLWAAAVRDCSLFARAARADCDQGGGRSYFAGLIHCRFKACPVCSGARLMTKAHEHDRLWLASGVNVLDVWRLNGPFAPPAHAMKVGNAAFRAWRERGRPGAAVAGASVLRTVELSPFGPPSEFARAQYLIAVPPGTLIEGWDGPVELVGERLGFDEVHEAQSETWGTMLAQVHDAAGLVDLLTALPKGTRLLEPLGSLRAAKSEARKGEKAKAEAETEAEAEGVPVRALRAARRPQGAPCPWCAGRHPISLEHFLFSAGRVEDGVLVFAWPDKPPGESQPPPPLRERQMAVTW